MKVLYEDCVKPGCIGKSNTNNLPALTDVSENPYGKKKILFRDATQKSAPLVPRGIGIKMVPRRPIFEKCSHLREKGGVLTLRTPVGFALTPREALRRVNIFPSLETLKNVI